MPARNAIKTYLENGYYHIYNRGVEKREIFLDRQDYEVFLSYLEDYLTERDLDKLRNELSNKELDWIKKEQILRKININNFNGEVTLLCYCLIPNHFHFLIKQKGQNSIDHFMRSLCTRYTLYFNKKYKRVGPLYQGVYKAVMVESDEQLLELSRYIQHQALFHQPEPEHTLAEQPSSYYCYTGKEKCDWVNTTEILSFFNQKSINPLLSYEGFVSQQKDSPLNQKLLIEVA